MSFTPKNEILVSICPSVHDQREEPVQGGENESLSADLSLSVWVVEAFHTRAFFSSVFFNGGQLGVPLLKMAMCVFPLGSTCFH